MSSNPMTSGGLGGASYAIPDVMSYPDNPPSSVTDAQYLADEAGLRQQINSQYQDLLGQLGYMDPVSGAFIPGSVEQNADIQQGNLGQAMGQADIQVDQNAQNNGILFSGVRGTQRAQAEMPYLQQIGQLGFDTTNTLEDLYRQAQGLMGTYTTENQKLLADAAARAAAAAIANPVDQKRVDPGAGQGPPAPPPVPTPTPTDPSVTFTGSTPEQAGPTSTDITPATDPSTTGGATGGAGGGQMYAYAKGGEIKRPTNAILGENATPGDPRSHEVVIPRNKLSKEGNSMLDHLMTMAHIQHAAQGRLGHLGGHLVNAEVLRQEGRDQAAAALWEQRHPYAMRHGLEPHWVERTQRDQIPTHPLDAGTPPTHGGGYFGGGVPHPLPPTPALGDPGIHAFGPGGGVPVFHPRHRVAQGIDQMLHRATSGMDPDEAHHRIAHAIGLAALARLRQPNGMTPNPLDAIHALTQPPLHGVMPSGPPQPPETSPMDTINDAVHAIMPAPAPVSGMQPY